MSKDGHLGYVAAVPIPEVLQGINAYTLGAQTINPNVKVDVVWTNTWYDRARKPMRPIRLSARAATSSRTTPTPRLWPLRPKART